MRNPKNTLLFRWFQEVWNGNNRNSIDELLAENVITHGLSSENQNHGIEEFKKYYDNFRSEFGDVQVTVHDVISEDDMSCVLCTFTATQIATGKKVTVSGQCWVRIEDGKIAEAWNHFEFLNMYQQLGYSLTL